MTEENKVILDTDKLPNFADTFIDINTYRRLEQENKELLEARNHFMGVNLKYFNALEEIREIITSAFAKQRPYKEDFAEIETKINEVLK